MYVDSLTSFTHFPAYFFDIICMYDEVITYEFIFFLVDSFVDFLVSESLDYVRN